MGHSSKHDGTGVSLSQIIALHGFPDGPKTFEPLRSALESAGFNLSCPFLPGHDRGSLARFQDACRRDSPVEAALSLLLEDLPREPVHLIGHDWGAVLGYALTAIAPERFLSFSALSIPPLDAPLAQARAHPLGLLRFWYIALFQVPYLGERLASDPRFIDTLITRFSPGFVLPPTLRSDIHARYADRPLLSAVLAYYRSLKYPSTWRRFAPPSPVPTLVLHGALDGCFPPAIFPEAVRHSRRPTQLVTLEGCGHFPHLERPEAVLGRLLAFLSRTRSD
jgi:pimeloyl-ACP methyl ester carboxylesterase